MESKEKMREIKQKAHEKTLKWIVGRNFRKKKNKI